MRPGWYYLTCLFCIPELIEKLPFFLEFRESLKLNGRTVNAIICCVRGFFKYLQRIEYLDENPLLDIPQVKESAFIPFVFSPEQTELLLVTIQKRIRQSEKHFLYDLAEYVALFLLAQCGLRISEPIRLLRSHFRPHEASIYIEKTKFAKDRLIPIPRRVVGEVGNYLAVRRSFLGEDQSPYLLICGKDKQLTRVQLYPTFNRAVKSMGLDQKKQTIGQTTFGRPTPHSLSHQYSASDKKERQINTKCPARISYLYGTLSV